MYGLWSYILIYRTVVLIKFLPYSGATAQTRSVALWGVSGSYGQAPAQQGMSGLVRETSHLCLCSSPSPSLQPILRESATSILIVLCTFELIMWVANVNRCEDMYRATSEFSNFSFIIFSPCDWSDALKRRISYMLSIYKQTDIYIYIYPWYKQPLASLHFYLNWWNKKQSITFIFTHNLLYGL